MKGVIRQLIAKTKADIQSCKSAYLYVDGDIGLMEVNELAKELETLLGDDVHIAFTASYDSSKEEEYDVMVLLAS